MEHQRAALARNAQNQWGAHFCTEYGNSPIPDIPFTAKIVRTNYHVDRKLAEAITTDQHGQQLEAPPNRQEKIASQAHACAETLTLAWTLLYISASLIFVSFAFVSFCT